MSNSDFEKADRIVLKAIAEKQNENSIYFPEKTLNAYLRQYITYITEKNEKIVFINFICRLDEVPPNIDSGETEFKLQDWGKDLIWPDDGSDCYWRIWINLSTIKYTIMINGI